MSLIKTAVISAAILIVAGCNRNPVTNDTGDFSKDIVSEKSSLLRELHPDVDQSEMGKIVSGNTQFALDLYSILAKNDGNVFFSPYSISTALAMTYGGARNKTADEMRSMLNFTVDDADLHKAFNSLDQRLNSTDNVTLSIVNQAWGRPDIEFQPEYLDLLAVNYGSGMNILDFAGDPDGSRQIINSWVAVKTNEKILELLPEESITGNTALVLTNAIYFLGDWLYRFDKSLTMEKPFHLQDGATVSVPMMSLFKDGQSGNINCVANDYCTAIELPYKGEQISMVIILPADSDIGKLEQQLTNERISQIANSFESTELHCVQIPRFSFTTGSINLNDALKQLGMREAFSSDADFSGIAGEHKLEVSNVFHKAFINVNENGTEAAAATAVIIEDRAAQFSSFVADRPFLFLIRDRVSGTILFMGRVMNPLQS